MHAEWSKTELGDEVHVECGKRQQGGDKRDAGRGCMAVRFHGRCCVVKRGW